MKKKKYSGFTVNRKVSFHFPYFESIRNEKAIKEYGYEFGFNGKELSLQHVLCEYPDIYLKSTCSEARIHFW